MDASQYLRRLKESCTQKIARPKCIDASLRTQIVRNAATTKYVSPVAKPVSAPSGCCTKLPETAVKYDGAVTPIVLPDTECIAQAACNDLENRYANPIILPGCPIPYTSSSYVRADSYKYQGTREQTSEAVRLRGCKDCTRPPPPPSPGCLSFYKGILRTPVVSGFELGTGEFTVEWFQKLVPLSSFPEEFGNEYYYTLFTIGNLANETEAMSFYFKVAPPDPNSYEVILTQGNGPKFWPFGSFGTTGSRPVSDLENQWIHIALVGDGGGEEFGGLRLYVQGTQFGSFFNNGYNFLLSGQPYLTIGGQAPLDPKYYFNGCITNFRFTKGEAIYTEEFTPPTAPLSVRPTTQLLLPTLSNNPAGDISIPNKPITDVGPINFQEDSPFPQ
jgi:hypothetical protein